MGSVTERHRGSTYGPARRLRTSLASMTLLLVAGCGDDDTSADPDDPSTTSTTVAEAAGSIPTGPIVFAGVPPDASEDGTRIYATNVDGSEAAQLFDDAAEAPRWSPDGAAISFFCCDDGNAAHILDVATGEVRPVPQPDPALELYCGSAWTADSKRLACEGFGVDDPSLNGIYTISASGGGDVTRITSNPGFNDIAGDFSPDGTRLVFMRFQDDRPVGLFVADADGGNVMQLPTSGLLLDDSGHAGRWSPSGDRILFVARSAEELHKAIWIVDAAGGQPQPLTMTPACGGPFAPGEHGCYWPSWSPDGRQIVFTRSDDERDAGIYLVNADGSGVAGVAEGEHDQADWGSP